jgi:hypothetical protein
MTQPGRKSAAEVEMSVLKLATSSPKPLSIPDILTPAEQALFKQLRATNKHITDTDVPLLVCYCQAITQCHKLGKKGRVLDWERAVRVLMALSTKLKLTPQADRRVDRTGGCGVTWRQLEQQGLTEFNEEIAPTKPWEDSDDASHE